MNRLWVRLTLGFALAVLVAVGAIAILIDRAAGVEFRQYVTLSGMRASGSGLQMLVQYYQQTGSWDGVGGLLAEGVYINGPLGSDLSPMLAAARRPGLPGRRLDVVLADAKGKVVFDSAGEAVGKQLKASEEARALPITDSDSGEVIGYLLLAYPAPPNFLGTLEQRFLDRLQEVLLLGAALAVSLGLIFSAILSRSMTAPLRRLAVAARTVAGGDLGQRVKVEGSVEMAEVGQAFNEMTSALEKAETLRQNMVADVAHELRTPLSVLQGNLRAILDDVYALDKAEISRLYDETRLLSRLVDDLRELALADAGQLLLNLRPTDVARVIRTTVDNLALAAEAQEVDLAANLPEGAAPALPPVLADPDRVAQVLRNLLVNALRHTPPHGSVTVTATPANGMVEIAVTDTGEGIAPEHLPHVFERFWRADAARSHGGGNQRFAGGTGLGLSVAQSLVKAQGGRIWAESELHKGSTFRFTLPMA